MNTAERGKPKGSGKGKARPDTHKQMQSVVTRSVVLFILKSLRV